MEGTAPEDYSVAQLLRAEADPLFAYELKGGVLEPGEERAAPPPATRGKRSLDVPLVHDALAQALAGKRKKAFEGDSPDARARPIDRSAIGDEAPPPSQSHAALQPTGGKLLEDLVSEATRGLAVDWREAELDVPGGLALPEALATAARAVAGGTPVPCAIGPAAGRHRRFVLLLQLSTAGKTRAWQLYDPLSQELVWAHEADLLAGTELPFSNKVNRRLTRIVLPQSLRATF